MPTFFQGEWRYSSKSRFLWTKRPFWCFLEILTLHSFSNHMMKAWFKVNQPINSNCFKWNIFWVANVKMMFWLPELPWQNMRYIMQFWHIYDFGRTSLQPCHCTNLFGCGSSLELKSKLQNLWWSNFFFSIDVGVASSMSCFWLPFWLWHLLCTIWILLDSHQVAADEFATLSLSSSNLPLLKKRNIALELHRLMLNCLMLLFGCPMPLPFDKVGHHHHCGLSGPSRSCENSLLNTQQMHSDLKGWYGWEKKTHYVYD